MMVSKLTAWLGLPEAGIQVSEDFALPPVLSDIGDDGPVDICGSRGSVICLSGIIFWKLFPKYKYLFFFWSK